MKRTVFALAVLFAVLSSVGWAQTASPAYYDRFNGSWIDRAKWLTVGPWCGFQGPTLECVREIQNGRLRMEARVFGGTDSDAGIQFTSSQLHFVNPQAINSVAVDITTGRVNGVGCSTNSTDITRGITGIRGNFFNAGSGYPADDIWQSVYFQIDTNSPKTIRVISWMDIGVGADLGQYPIGTPLTVLNQWDKVNHQFISEVRVTGDTGRGKRVVVPYYVSDIAPPANPDKYLLTWSYSLNCTAVQTFSETETFFDNVMINPVPPNQNQQ